MNPQPSSRCSLSMLLAVCLVLGNGCGDANPSGRIPVTGEVTLDGMPIDAGTIEFSPVAGKIGSGGKITAGKYSLPLTKGIPPGEYIVRITSPANSPSPAVVASKLPGMETEEIPLGKERVHARYNSNSELKLVVPPDNTPFNKDFEVKSR